MKEIHPNIRQTDSGAIYTRNLAPGEKVYGERLKTHKNTEYRKWEADRSKLGAAIRKGLPEVPIQQDSRVLYLGAASGTTPSHVSDIARDGIVHGLEYSPTVVRQLLELSQDRPNLAPIMADARKPAEYARLIDQVDVLIQDIAQPDQYAIAKRNAETFLRDGGDLLIAIKARSISSSRPVEKVLSSQREKLGEGFDVRWTSRLEPYEQDHLFVWAQK